jgi:hypothetical protein
MRSDLAVGYGNEVRSRHEDNGKIFLKKDSKSVPWIIGSCGDPRCRQVVQAAVGIDIQEDDDPELFVVRSLVEPMRRAFEKAGCLRKKDSEQSYDGMFLVGTRGNLFVVTSYFAVQRASQPYETVGSGSMVAWGSLDTSADLDLSPEIRLKRALQAAGRRMDSVGGIGRLFTDAVG